LRGLAGLARTLHTPHTTLSPSALGTPRDGGAARTRAARGATTHAAARVHRTRVLARALLVAEEGGHGGGRGGVGGGVGGGGGGALGHTPVPGNQHRSFLRPPWQHYQNEHGGRHWPSQRTSPSPRTRTTPTRRANQRPPPFAPRALRSPHPLHPPPLPDLSFSLLIARRPPPPSPPFAPTLLYRSALYFDPPVSIGVWFVSSST